MREKINKKQKIPGSPPPPAWVTFKKKIGSIPPITKGFDCKFVQMGVVSAPLETKKLTMLAEGSMVKSKDEVIFTQMEQLRYRYVAEF